VTVSYQLGRGGGRLAIRQRLTGVITSIPSALGWRPCSLAGRFPVLTIRSISREAQALTSVTWDAMCCARRTRATWIVHSWSFPIRESRTASSAPTF